MLLDFGNANIPIEEDHMDRMKGKAAEDGIDNLQKKQTHSFSISSNSKKIEDDD